MSFLFCVKRKIFPNLLYIFSLSNQKTKTQELITIFEKIGLTNELPLVREVTLPDEYRFS